MKSQRSSVYEEKRDEINEAITLLFDEQMSNVTFSFVLNFHENNAEQIDSYKDVLGLFQFRARALSMPSSLQFPGNS